MKAMKSNQNLIIRIGNYIGKIAKAIVSGIPREKVFVKKDKKIVIHANKQTAKTKIEKHYHKPIAKPVVEKQTLIKEKRKEKGSASK